MKDKHRLCVWLAAAAALVLGAAAVGLGGLNQDEGWYLYAANLVAEGQMPYRDFAFTQGPVMPYVYSLFAGIWKAHGILGARIFNLSIGFLGIGFCCLLARRLGGSALAAFLLLACNLYHLYFLAIPKTYALAALAIAIACWCLTFEHWAAFFCAGFLLAVGAGVRISIGFMLPFVGIALLVTDKSRLKSNTVIFAAGGVVALAAVYGPFLIDPAARAGLFAAQAYHAARSGFDPAMAAGSLSRLVRWYLPVAVLAAIFVSRPSGGKAKAIFAAAFGVMAIQWCAPFPYEDYQVPLMGVVAAVASTAIAKERLPVLLLAVFALAFGNPLLEKWAVDGQDRFWPMKKDKPELALLKDAAHRIEALDPGGKTLLTQDLYLAIETGRKVPKGLEMGPFSILSHDEWIALLELSNCRVAAMSGYAFAIEPPKCDRRDMAEQLEFWRILKRRYRQAGYIGRFGQNATPLLILELID